MSVAVEPPNYPGMSAPKRVRPPHYRRDMDNIDMPSPVGSAALASSPSALDIDSPSLAARHGYTGHGASAPASSPASSPRHPPSSHRGGPPEQAPSRSPPRGAQAMRTRGPSYESGGCSAETPALGQNKPTEAGELTHRRGHRQSRSSSRPQSATDGNFLPPAQLQQRFPDRQQPGSSRSSNTNAAAGGGIPPRLKTPSVMDSVLHPLGQKVQEYERLMHEGQDEITRLDEELQALQARRNAAEGRFLDACARHEEWRQQYTDVERALKGELPTLRQPQQVAFQDVDDDGGDLPRQRPRPISHQDSFESTKSKTRVKNLLRLSFFGSS